MKWIKNITSMLFILLILYNVYLSLLFIHITEFDHDEFQHTHIAWNMYNGKIIYRDFFEHHGPIYPAINSIFLNTLSTPASINTLYLLRYLNIFYQLIIFVLTFAIGKKVLDSFEGGLLSVAALSSLSLYRDKAIEIRPDIIQNLFLMGSLLLLIFYLDQRNGKSSIRQIWYLFFSGIVFGLSMLSNAKASIFLIAILLFLIFKNILNQSNLWNLIYEGGMFLIGISSTIGISILIFLLNNAVGEFVFYNYIFNLIAVFKHQSRHIMEYFTIMVDVNLMFVVFFIIGLIFMAYKLIFSKIKRVNRYNQTMLIFISSIIGLISLFMGLYSQHYLSVLPVFSVAFSFGIINIVYILSSKYNISSHLLFIILVFVLFFGLTQLSAKSVYYGYKGMHDQQIGLTKYIIEKTSRDDPIFFYWNNCGGYMFNEDVQYYWMAAELSDLFKDVEGYDVFGEKLIHSLENKKVKYLIATNEELKQLPHVTFQYIRENYYQTTNECIFIRKELS